MTKMTATTTILLLVPILFFHYYMHHCYPYIYQWNHRNDNSYHHNQMKGSGHGAAFIFTTAFSPHSLSPFSPPLAHIPYFSPPSCNFFPIMYRSIVSRDLLSPSSLPSSFGSAESGLGGDHEKDEDGVYDNHGAVGNRDWKSYTDDWDDAFFWDDGDTDEDSDFETERDDGVLLLDRGSENKIKIEASREKDNGSNNTSIVSRNFLSPSSENYEEDNNNEKSNSKDSNPLPLNPLNLAPASEIAYFYLKNEIGIPEYEMFRIIDKAGLVLGFSVANLREKVGVLRELLNLKDDDDMRTIIVKHPSILHLGAKGRRSNLRTTVEYLRKAYDLSKDELRRIVLVRPCVLAYSMKNLKSKESFFKTRAGLNGRTLSRVILAEPQLLTSNAVTGLRSRWDFLKDEMCIPSDTLRDIVIRNPRILMLSVNDNLIPKLVSLLIMKLRFRPPHHVARLLGRFPQFVNYGLETTMMPMIVYLQNELDFAPTQIRDMMLKYPRLLTHSVGKVKCLVAYLRYGLGLDMTQVRCVFERAPQVISLDIDGNISRKIRFLRGDSNSAGSTKYGLINDVFPLTNVANSNVNNKNNNDGVRLFFSDEDIRTIITKNPTLLLCNIERNLRPKVEYLLMRFEGDIYEVMDVILVLPALLSYSLDKRLKPRLESIHDVGVSLRSITVGITLTEERFNEWLVGKANAVLWSRAKLQLGNEMTSQGLEGGEGGIRTAFVDGNVNNDNLDNDSGSIASKFRPGSVLGYLRDGLGIDDKRLRRILTRAPRLVHVDVDEEMEDRVRYLRETLGLMNNGEEKINKYNDNINDEETKKVEREETIRKIVSGMPTVLLSDVEADLRPRIEYLLSEFNGDIIAVRTVIATVPYLLGYDLYDRLIPRMERVKDAGLSPSLITVGAALSEGRFREWLEGKRMKKLEADAKAKVEAAVVVEIGDDLWSKGVVVEVDYTATSDDSEDDNYHKNLHNFINRTGNINDYVSNDDDLESDTSSSDGVINFLRYDLGMDELRIKRILTKSVGITSLALLQKKKNVEEGGLTVDMSDDYDGYCDKGNHNDDNHNNHDFLGKIHFLCDALHIDKDDHECLGVLIEKYPSLLLCDVEENLRPKIKFIISPFDKDKSNANTTNDTPFIEGDRDQTITYAESLRKALVSHPSVLRFSLEGRIRPRIRKMIEVFRHGNIGKNQYAKLVIEGLCVAEGKFNKWLNANTSKKSSLTITDSNIVIDGSAITDTIYQRQGN